MSTRSQRLCLTRLLPQGPGLQVCNMSSSQKADLAISSGTCTHIWHCPGAQSHTTSLSHDGPVNTSRWNQNNRVVVTAGTSGQLALNYVTGTVMGLLPPQPDNSLPAVNTVCFSKGSKFLATGCANGEVKVWNLKRQARQLLRLHDVPAAACSCVSMTAPLQHKRQSLMYITALPCFLGIHAAS